MKNRILLALICLPLLTPSLFGQTNAPANSPRGQLQQLTAQLQNSPDDEALREKIIALALTLNPRPATPDAATMAEGGAEYAFKNAQGNSDFSDAAKQYEKALLLAPWLAGDYFNCGVAHEKAGENKEAIRSFNFYLLAAPNADDAQSVKKRIGGLQYAAQKAEAQADEAARKEADIHIGASHGGGVIFFVDGTGQHGRIAATADQSAGTNWSNSVQLCRNYRGGGYSDWYMPSIIELGWLYEQRDVVGGFTQWAYWSSTEGFRGVAQNGVAILIFETGAVKDHVNANYKGNPVRAIRAF